MCNLYSMTSNAEAIRQFANHLRDIVGNLAVQPGIFPDYAAPIVRHTPDGVRELSMARWGMPSSQFALMESTKKRAAKLEAKGKPVDSKELLRMEPDAGTTNIRNTASKRRKPAADVLCRDMDELDVGSQSEDWRRDDRRPRLPDDRAERRGRADPSQGHAGHFDNARGDRDLADGADA
jgi:hypothetical protein